MAHFLPKKKDNLTAPLTTFSAEEELDDILGGNNEDIEEVSIVPPSTVNSAAPTEISTSSPKESASVKPKAPKKTTSSKGKAGKSKSATPSRESNLRKTAPDPNAQRISARVPRELYIEMMNLRASLGFSMDHTITNAVKTVLRHKYSCACGCTFYMDASESASTVPTVCPSCGNKNIRQVKANR